jgi:hypothetical protein
MSFECQCDQEHRGIEIPAHGWKPAELGYIPTTPLSLTSFRRVDSLQDLQLEDEPM